MSVLARLKQMWTKENVPAAVMAIRHDVRLAVEENREAAEKLRKVIEEKTLANTLRDITRKM